MPPPLWKQRENELKRRRICAVCGAQFRAPQPSKKTRSCSFECATKLNAAAHEGKKQSEETRAKRSTTLLKWSEVNPAASRLRVEKAKRACLEWYASPANDARKMELREIARQSISVINERDAELNKLILKRAHQELRADTDYCEVFTDVQDLLRREMPYDGPKEGSDYYEYLQKLGRATATHPRCQEIFTAFMAEAIPRISKELRAQWDRNPKGGNVVPSRSDESPVPEGDAPKDSQ